MPVVGPISNLESDGKGPMDERLSKSETGVLNGSSRLPSLSLLSASSQRCTPFVATSSERRSVRQGFIDMPRCTQGSETFAPEVNEQLTRQATFTLRQLFQGEGVKINMVGQHHPRISEFVCDVEKRFRRLRKVLRVQ